MTPKEVVKEETERDNKKRKGFETNSAESSQGRAKKLAAETSAVGTVNTGGQSPVAGGAASPAAAAGTPGGTSGVSDNPKNEIIELLAKQLSSPDADCVEAAMVRLTDLLEGENDGKT